MTRRADWPSPQFCTFDELVAVAPEHLRATHAAYIENMEARGLGALTPRQAEFVIAGHSQGRDSLEGYLLRTSPGSGLEAWTLYPIPDDLISPISDRIIEAASEIAADVGAPGEAPEAWAMRLVEAQRTHPLMMENGREVVVAGVFCQLTTLTRSDISTKILRRWPEGMR
ncbi:hypothetical protein [Methylobacterium sp. B4]|uniref:hypothetical protein n=1 Tax=Methylobacterium sp. B4 TaxID=1938755 RepID=UPI0011B690A0|nr:hypothetical protein [Methylobacterium sp. B4]